MNARFLIALPLAATLVAAAAPAQAADVPEIRRSASLAFTSGEPGGWSGQLSFGLVTTGSSDARVVRATPISLHLERRVCDLAGCVLTTMDLPEGGSVSGAPRIAAQVSSAALPPVVLGVVVRRSVDGSMPIVSQGVITVAADARKCGRVVKETTLVEAGGTQQMTITLTAPVRATIAFGDDTVAATGTASKVRVVG